MVMRGVMFQCNAFLGLLAGFLPRAGNWKVLGKTSAHGRSRSRDIVRACAAVAAKTRGTLAIGWPRSGHWTLESWAGLGWAGLGWAEHDCSMTRQYFLLTKVAACTLGLASLGTAVAEIIDLDQQAQ